MICLVPSLTTALKETGGMVLMVADNLHGLIFTNRTNSGAHNLLTAINYKMPPRKPGAWVSDNLHGLFFTIRNEVQCT